MKYPGVLKMYERIEKNRTQTSRSIAKTDHAGDDAGQESLLCQRPPRIAIAGETGPVQAHVLNALFNAAILQTEGDITISGWHDFVRTGHGAIRLLDARRSTPESVIKTALTEEGPHVFLFLRSTAAVDDALAEDIAHFNSIIEFLNTRGLREAVIGVLIRHDPGAETETAREQLHACLHTKPAISERLAATLSIAAAIRFRLDGTVDENTTDRERIGRLAQVIAKELPEEARLEKRGSAASANCKRRSPRHSSRPSPRSAPQSARSRSRSPISRC